MEKERARSAQSENRAKEPSPSDGLRQDMTFDEAFDLLRGEAEKISSENISLEDAIESYRRGKLYYEFCRKKLDDAQQTIRIFDRDSGELKEMNTDGAEQDRRTAE